MWTTVSCVKVLCITFGYPLQPPPRLCSTTTSTFWTGKTFSVNIFKAATPSKHILQNHLVFQLLQWCCCLRFEQLSWWVKCKPNWWPERWPSDNYKKEYPIRQYNKLTEHRTTDASGPCLQQIVLHTHTQTPTHFHSNTHTDKRKLVDPVHLPFMLFTGICVLSACCYGIFSTRPSLAHAGPLKPTSTNKHTQTTGTREHK